MKTNKSHKKLFLNKKTIAALDCRSMNGIYGGTLPTEMHCKTTRDYPCPTDVELCGKTVLVCIM
jgi:hypothetical protein